jgi:hypothetical protein
VADLSPADVQLQAKALADFVRRGGSVSRWLDSKDFAPADRDAVLLAWADLEDWP